VIDSRAKKKKGTDLFFHILLFVFAWQIGVRGKMELIAGYNRKTASELPTRPGSGG
jgi:hypothetical protein